MNSFGALPAADFDEAADVDSWEVLIAAIIAEAGELKVRDRAQLASRVLALGGYESPDAPEVENERARLAIRLAARLASTGS